MRSKRMKLTSNDYKSMELVMSNFKATGLRKVMINATSMHYKRISDRGVK